MADINIASPGGDEAALRAALLGLVGWEEHDVWDHSVDGNASAVDFTGLDDVTEIFVLARAVTKSVSGLMRGYVSVDDGSSFYSTSGDYVSVTRTGVESNSGSAGDLHFTTTDAARGGWLHVKKMPTPIIFEGRRSEVDLACRLFVASSSVINAVRILPSAGGNFTGGKFHCYVR